jgi:hypothetical protein
MASRLIELSDDILVEIDVPEAQARQISSSLADKVDSAMDKIQPILISICRPVAEAWKNLSSDFQVEEAEIEIGLSFEAEGNIYITKSKAGANVTVRLKMKLRS